MMYSPRSLSTSELKEVSSNIKEGRRHYGSKRFKPALEHFTRAMRICPCNRGMKRERCGCKNYEEVALQDGSIFNEAMYKCSCHVGKTFNKCENEFHIQALDYRAATFEALEELGRAQRDAEWILELAPRMPDGYLRLGKIMRLQKKDELAWKIYGAGIEVGENNRLAGSPKLQKLYSARKSLQFRFCRRDPLRNPMEIVQRIFSYVDFPSLIRCLRVSKEWQRYLTGRGNERLWRSLPLDIPSPRRLAASTNALRKLLSYSNNDVRRLMINARQLKLTQSKFLALLQGSKNLEYLSIREEPEEAIQFPRQSGVLSKLTHLIFDGSSPRTPILMPILANARDQMQYLHIYGFEALDYDVYFPEMPRLKYLRLEEHDTGLLETGQRNIRIAEKTPNLEQLFVRDMNADFLSSDHVGPLWENLKVIVAGSFMGNHASAAWQMRSLCSIGQGKGLRYIDLQLAAMFEFDNLGIGTAFNPHENMPARPRDNHSDLRSLRLGRALIPPEKLQESLADSIEAGKLHTLDIEFPLEPTRASLGATSTAHLEKYKWLRGAPCIRHLGIFNFQFKSYYRTEDEMPLLSFLASFPNLETLEIKSMHYTSQELALDLAAILRVTRLKTMYQSTVQGVTLDKLMEHAKGLGVNLVFGERPRAWPVPIEE